MGNGIINQLVPQYPTYWVTYMFHLIIESNLSKPHVFVVYVYVRMYIFQIASVLIIQKQKNSINFDKNLTLAVITLYFEIWSQTL